MNVLVKNNRPLFCLLFSNLIILKQGIEIQSFFSNRLWRFLKTGHLPVMLHSSAPSLGFYTTKCFQSFLLFRPGGQHFKLYANSCLGAVSDTLYFVNKLIYFCHCLLEQLVKLVSRDWSVTRFKNQ